MNRKAKPTSRVRGPSGIHSTWIVMGLNEKEQIVTSRCESGKGHDFAHSAGWPEQTELMNTHFADSYNCAELHHDNRSQLYILYGVLPNECFGKRNVEKTCGNHGIDMPKTKRILPGGPTVAELALVLVHLLDIVFEPTANRQLQVFDSKLQRLPRGNESEKLKASR